MNAAEYYKSILKDRNEWRSSQPQVCMWCGFGESWLGLETHEIERRSAAPKRFHHRSNLLLLCHGCHAEIVGPMDKVRQLALKKLRDPNEYSLIDWLRIADPELRAPNRITQEEVDVVVLNLPKTSSGLRF